MTQATLELAVAGRTGETARLIRRLGFGPLALTAQAPAPEAIRLVLDCPFCGRPTSYPGRSADSCLALAECPRCDVDFDFAEAEVYVADDHARSA